MKLEGERKGIFKRFIEEGSLTGSVGRVCTS